MFIYSIYIYRYTFIQLYILTICSYSIGVYGICIFIPINIIYDICAFVSLWLALYMQLCVYESIHGLLLEGTQALESDRSRCEIQLLRSVSIKLQMIYFTTLSLAFLLCKHGIMTVSTLESLL